MTLFDVASLKETIDKLTIETNNPNFWNNQNKAKTIIKKLNAAKEKFNIYSLVETTVESAFELLKDDTFAEDSEYLSDLAFEIDNAQKEGELLINLLLFSGEYDENDATVSIHAGAGGTESHDWADMLYHMSVSYTHLVGLNY